MILHHYNNEVHGKRCNHQEHFPKSHCELSQSMGNQKECEVIVNNECQDNFT